MIMGIFTFKMVVNSHKAVVEGTTNADGWFWVDLALFPCTSKMGIKSLQQNPYPV